METTLKFARLHENAIIPSKRAEDAGYDIYACLNLACIIDPHETVLVPTGIASVIPEGYYMQIEERGPTGSKGIKKSAGVIDSGYRGEWFIAITNSTDKTLVLSDNPNEHKVRYDTDSNGNARIVYPAATKAIAQAVLHKVIPAEVEEITKEELAAFTSQRGSGALGSSNK